MSVRRMQIGGKAEKPPLKSGRIGGTRRAGDSIVEGHASEAGRIFMCK